MYQSQPFQSVQSPWKALFKIAIFHRIFKKSQDRHWSHPGLNQGPSRCKTNALPLWATRKLGQRARKLTINFFTRCSTLVVIWPEKWKLMIYPKFWKCMHSLLDQEIFDNKFPWSFLFYYRTQVENWPTLHTWISVLTVNLASCLSMIKLISRW